MRGFSRDPPHTLELSESNTDSGILGSLPGSLVLCRSLYLNNCLCKYIWPHMVLSSSRVVRLLACLLLRYALEMLVFPVNNRKANSGLNTFLFEQIDDHLKTDLLPALGLCCSPELFIDWWVPAFLSFVLSAFERFPEVQSSNLTSLLHQQMFQSRSYGKQCASQCCVQIIVLHRLTRPSILLLCCPHASSMCLTIF